MFKQVYLYDGTAELIESITKYKLGNGEIVDEVPVPIEVEKEIDVVSEDTDEIIRETITVYEDVQYEEIEIFEYPEEYTELQPEDGLYQPIFFDGEKWVGTKKGDWEAANPPEPTENQSISNEEMQHLIEDLTLQLLSLQIEIDEKKVLENE